MSRATHRGTCQCCGREQKLPRGALSLHGYTTTWGYFSGTCAGARQLPLEVDRSILDTHVARLRTFAERMESEDPGRVRCSVADRRERDGVRSRYVPGYVENDLDAFRALALENRGRWHDACWPTWRPEEDVIRERFSAAQKQAKDRMLRDAAGARHHVETLLGLAERIHGRELQEV